MCAFFDVFYSRRERERERVRVREQQRLVRGNKCVEDMSAIPVCGMSKETVHYIVISTVTLCNSFIDNCLYIYKMYEGQSL